MSTVQIVLAGFLFSLSIILTKYHLLKEFSSVEVLATRQIFGFILVLFYLLYNKKFIKKLVSTKKKTYVYFIITFLCIFVAIILFWNALYKQKAFYTISFLKPVEILFTTILAIYFFNEKSTFIEMLGIIFIIIGIVLINKNVK